MTMPELKSFMGKQLSARGLVPDFRRFAAAGTITGKELCRWLLSQPDQ
jgi:hypothetical protein